MTTAATPIRECDAALDYLYDLVSPEAKVRFEAHLAGCARCQEELAAFGKVRAVARETLPPVEPSGRLTGALHAQLMHAAAQRKPRGRVLPFVRRFVSNPAYAAAAGLLIVGGAVGMQWSRGRLVMPPPTASTPAAAADPKPAGAPGEAPMPPAPAQVAAAPAVEGKTEAEAGKREDVGGAFAADAEKALPARRLAPRVVTPAAHGPSDKTRAISAQFKDDADSLGGAYGGVGNPGKAKRKDEAGLDDLTPGGLASTGKGGSGAGRGNQAAAPSGRAAAGPMPAAEPQMLQRPLAEKERAQPSAPPPPASTAPAPQKKVASAPPEPVKPRPADRATREEAPARRPLARNDDEGLANGDVARLDAPAQPKAANAAESAASSSTDVGTNTNARDGKLQGQIISDGIDGERERAAQLAKAGRCDEASTIYDTIERKARDRLTAQDRVSYARCLRVLGRLDPAQNELDLAKRARGYGAALGEEQKQLDERRKNQAAADARSTGDRPQNTSKSKRGVRSVNKAPADLEQAAPDGNATKRAY